jgi:hypothetical protein
LLAYYADYYGAYYADYYLQATKDVLKEIHQIDGKGYEKEETHETKITPKDEDF